MLRLTLFACILGFVTAAGFINWESSGGPFRQERFRKIESILSKLHKSEKKNTQSENNHAVCRTQACFKVAAEFWESMNKSVNPCDDFYQYACGNWAINNPIPPSEMTWDTMEKMLRELQYKVRDFLEEDVGSDDILPVKQVKKFYKSCVNVDELEITGLKPLEAILVRNGGWPMIMEPEEWEPNQFSWQQIDDYYSHLTHSAFYSFEIKKDERKIQSFHDYKKENSTVIELKIPQLPPVVSMPYNMDLNRTKMYGDGSYAKFIKEVALAFIQEREAHISEEQLDTDIEDMIDFEKKLGTKSYISNNEPTFGPIEFIEKIGLERLSQLKNMPQINWKQTMANLFAEVNIKLNGDEIFYLEPQVIAYLEKLETILDETKPRTLVNYIHWNFLSQMLPYTNSKMRELSYELKKHLSGVKTEKPRWETCVEDMKMKHAVAYYFVKKYFKDDMREEGEKIFSSIQKEITKQILKSDWMSDKFRKITIEKIQSMQTIIGYPNWYDNDTALVNFYRGMPIGHHYLDNILMYQKYSLKKRLRTLKNPAIDIEWYPTLVNAAYNRLYNELIIPAGMFQFPFYSVAQPETINFGGLGIVMGHEVGHGFDITGMLFDKNGHEVDFSEKDESVFMEKAACFMSDADELKTLGEDMSDLLGVDLVYQALQEIEKEKQEPRLPGFEDLTNEQAFFLSFAKVWCSSSTPEYDELVSKDDEHSKPHDRVIAVVRNSKGFSQAYNCPKDSPMNPQIKCKIF